MSKTQDLETDSRVWASSIGSSVIDICTTKDRGLALRPLRAPIAFEKLQPLRDLLARKDG